MDGPGDRGDGLTVGWITADSTREERRAAYQCNVTYASVSGSASTCCATSWSPDVADLVSPNPDVALIDEADSVLVGRALVPLVLAGTTHPRDPQAGRSCSWSANSPRRGLRHRRRQPQHPSDRGRGAEDRRRSAGSTCTPRNTSAPPSPRSTRRPCTLCCCSATCTTSSATIIQLIHAPPAGGSPPCSAGRTGCRQPSRSGRASEPPGPVSPLLRHHHGAGADQPLSHRLRHDGHRAGRRRAAPVHKLGVSPIPPTPRTSAPTRPDRIYITAAAKNDAIIDHIIPDPRHRAAHPGRHPGRRGSGTCTLVCCAAVFRPSC